MVVAILISAAMGCTGIILIMIIHVCILRRCAAENSGNQINITAGVRIQGGSTTCKECAILSSDDLKKFPCFEYKEEDHINEGSSKECAVCLESFKIGEQCRLLPICNHSFHVACIDSWLLKTPSCPVCRSCASTIDTDH